MTNGEKYRHGRFQIQLEEDGGGKKFTDVAHYITIQSSV